MIDFKQRVLDFAQNKLGLQILEIELASAPQLTYPIYKAYVLDKESETTAILEISENSCIYASHTRKVIVNKVDFSHDWQNFNIEQTEDNKTKILFLESFLHHNLNCLNEKIAEFQEDVSTMVSSQPDLDDINENCKHIEALEEQWLDTRLAMKPNRQDELEIEHHIRSASMRYSHQIQQLINSVQEERIHFLTDEEISDTQKALEDIKYSFEFMSNRLIYKMDQILGYIPSKEE